MSRRALPRILMPQRLPVLTGGFAVAIGVAALLGWSLDVALLRSFVPGQVAMKPNTAIGFLLAGSALLLACPAGPAYRLAWARVLAGLTIGVGLLTLLEYLLGWDLRVDQLLFHEAPGAVGTLAPGRMAPASALGFVLVGMTLLVHKLEGRAAWLPTALGIAVAVPGVVSLVGLIFAVPNLYGVGIHAQLAVPTSLAFIALAVGLGALRPESGLLGVLLANDTGGVIARRLIPVAVFLPLVWGAAMLAGKRSGLWEPDFGIVLTVLAYLAVGCSACYWAARLVSRTQTERRLAHQRLRLLDTALDGAVNSVVITDRNGLIEWVNPAFTRASGYEPVEVLGQTPRVLKSGRQSDVYYAEMWRALGQGQVWRGEFVNRRKNGELYIEDSTITPVQDAAGQITHYIAIKLDITARRALEQQLLQAQKMEAIGQLAGGVAHDFNNILAVVDVCTDMLLSELPAESPSRGDVEEIRDASKRGSALARQLLVFSRKQTVTPQLLAIDDAVSGALRMLSRVVGDGVQLQTRLQCPDVHVLMDPGQFEQVLVNLTINARDAMPQGGSITVATEPLADGVRLSVADTGSGMDAETLAHLFEPFFSTKPSERGTGLGLAVVHGVITHCGGSIAVESAPGHGTTFLITLPVAQEPELPALPAAALRILVVEGQGPSRQGLVRVLERAGHRVSAVDGRSAALALLPNLAPNLVICDLSLPDGSGLTARAELQRQQPGLPFLFTSGQAEDSAAFEQIRALDLPLLPKPFVPNDLLQLVARLGAATPRAVNGSPSETRQV